MPLSSLLLIGRCSNKVVYVSQGWLVLGLKPGHFYHLSQGLPPKMIPRITGTNEVRASQLAQA